MQLSIQAQPPEQSLYFKLLTPSKGSTSVTCLLLVIKKHGQYRPLTAIAFIYGYSLSNEVWPEIAVLP